MVNNSDDCANLFILPNGKPLSRDRLEKRIKVIAKKIGAPGGLHAWRRGCLTHYAGLGAPMPFLQMIAGHSSILTTQSYVRPDLEEVLERQKNW
jgi:integrase